MKQHSVNHEVLEPPHNPTDSPKPGGKRTDMVNAPTISVNPTSEESKKPNDNEGNVLVRKANKTAVNDLTGGNQGKFSNQYIFGDLEVDQGLFIPVKEGQTTDELVERYRKQVYHAHNDSSDVERDEHGDEILEMLCIKTRKRNDDGTLALDSFNNPIVGANFVQRPKLVSSRNYIVRAIVKDYDLGEGQKAPSDGVMIIRAL